MKSMPSLKFNARSHEGPQLRLVNTEQVDTQVTRPPRSPGGVVRIPVAVPVASISRGEQLEKRVQRMPSGPILMFEAEERGMKVVRRVLRAGVLVGMLATAWQAGVLLGAL